LVGILVWIVGFFFESVADQQKYLFKKSLGNKGKWIASGLWKYSRHPNYFGEILCWVGIYIFTTSALSGYSLLVGLISPLFIAGLLIFVTGIPPLERYADKTWGKNKDYLEYKRRTSVLVPWFRKA
jgi:steroid 5-alpha reductase family enzyme